MGYSELDALGLHGPVLFAGFCGGLVFVAIQPGRPSLWGACSNLIIATLTANFVASWLAELFHLGTALGFSAFLTGLTSTVICKRFLGQAKSWNLLGGTGKEEQR